VLALLFNEHESLRTQLLTLANLRTRFIFFQLKGKVLSLTGLIFAISTFGWAFLWFTPVYLAHLFCVKFDPKRKRLVDKIIKIWAQFSMLTVMYKPAISGLENLPSNDEAVMYCPNHCSFMGKIALLILRIVFRHIFLYSMNSRSSKLFLAGTLHYFPPFFCYSHFDDRYHDIVRFPSAVIQIH
jgi:hypothetical protein